VEAKARLFVGSDGQARVERTAPVPEDFPLPVTRVVRLLQAGTLPNGVRFDLLAIDPATFARAVYWNSAFSEVALEDLVGALEGREDARLPIVVAASAATPDFLQLGGRSVPVEVIGSASAFPGVSSGRPLVVASQARLEEAVAGSIDPLASRSASVQLWMTGSTAQVVQATAGLPFEPNLVLTAEEVADLPYIAAVIDTLVVLNILATVAGVLIVIVMIMYLQARQRAEAISFALSLRMGMAEASHRRALTLELGAMLAASCVVGMIVALVSAALLLPMLDPLSAIPPAPLFVLPLGWAAATLAVVVLVSWLGGRLTVRQAREAQIGEVLRVAE
jgi:putative ABC transport system permease protein